MAYIYVITNSVNGKQYVGKTNGSVEKRFKEHISDSKKERCEKRPLYNAMNKYDVENFSISVLEECSAEESSDKEVYWIGKLDTYGSNGYNATLGGDSKKYYDYQELADSYLKLGTLKAVCDKFNCDVYTVKTACKEYGIDIITVAEQNKKRNGKSVKCFTKKNEFIKDFSDMSDAARWLIEEEKASGQIKHISTNIGRAVSNERKTAYGYIWKGMSS